MFSRILWKLYMLSWVIQKEYLSDKWGIVAVLEIFGKDGFREEVLVGDNESNAIGGPLDADVVLDFLK